MQAVQDITSLDSIRKKVWPNAKAMADDIGQDYHKVRKWFARGRIPDYAWPVIIRKSADAGMPLTADQLLTLNQRKRRGKA